MEILQIIWNTLITPNKQLINLLKIPFSFLEMTITMLLFLEILNIKATKNQKIVFVVTTSILAIFSNFFILHPIFRFINIVILLLLIILIFKTSFLKSILAILIPLISLAIMEPAIIETFCFIFRIEHFDLSYIPLYKTLFLLTLYFCIYLLYRIAKYYNFNIYILNNIDKKNKYIILFNSILGFIAIATQIYLFKFYSTNIPNPIIIISLISLITYFFINLYSIVNTNKLKIIEQSLEESQLYNKSLKILHDTNRAFKHDFGNIVQAIGGYISTRDLDGLEEYYSQLLSDCQKVNNLYVLNPEIINNPAIYSILASKYYSADEAGIKINLDVFLDLNKLNMKIYEFTRILGILVDNAIEAVSGCNEKIINVEIRKDFKSERQIFYIENTYNEKEINIDKIFDKGYSSKANNTGLGLWEVKQILKRNNNLNLYTTKDEKFFKQQLEIYPTNSLKNSKQLVSSI